MNNFIQLILTGLLFGFFIPLLSDQLFIKKIIKQNCRYFAIHVIFNIWVTYINYNDVSTRQFRKDFLPPQKCEMSR